MRGYNTNGPISDLHKNKHHGMEKKKKDYDSGL